MLKAKPKKINTYLNIIISIDRKKYTERLGNQILDAISQINHHQCKSREDLGISRWGNRCYLSCCRIKEGSLNRLESILSHFPEITRIEYSY